MAQVVEDAKVALPHMHLEFFQHEGLVLAVLAADGDQQSLIATSKFAHSFTVKDSFGKYSSNLSGSGPVITEAAAQPTQPAYMYVLGNGLTSTESHTTLFPSDGAQIRVADETMNVTFLLDRTAWSLSSNEVRKVFSANLEDNMFAIAIERSQNSDTNITMQYGEHLVIRVLNNDAIVFEYPSSHRRKVKAVLGDGSLVEIQRTVTKSVYFLYLIWNVLEESPSTCYFCSGLYH
jgi:hypothetical protein